MSNPVTRTKNEIELEFARTQSLTQFGSFDSTKSLELGDTRWPSDEDDNNDHDNDNASSITSGSYASFKQLNQDLGVTGENIGRWGQTDDNASIDSEMCYDWRFPTDLAVQQAASFVDDAKSGRREMHTIDPKALKLYYIYHSSYIRCLIRICLLTQFLFNPLCEYPQTIKEIPLWVPAVLELIAIFVYLSTFFFLRARFLVRGALQKNRLVLLRNSLFVIFCVCVIIDIIVWFFCYAELGHGVRATRILRPYFILYYIKPLRMAMMSIIRMLPRLAEIVFLILSLLLIYSLIGYLLFLDTDEGKMYMDSYWHAFLSFYVLMTTANFPDVMMPAYSQYHWTALIFISFLVIVTYFLLNLVLAMIFNVYSELMRIQFREIVLFERQRLAFAFALLDPAETGGIDFKTWHHFITRLRSEYSSSKSAFLFRVLNVSNSDRITPSEFLALLNVLQMAIYKKQLSPPFFEKHLRQFFKTPFIRFMKEFIVSKVFQSVMVLVVILNVSMIVWQFTSQRDCKVVAKQVEFLFLFLFYTELLLIIFLRGTRYYFSSVTRNLNFLILMISTVIIIIVRVSEADCANLFLKLLFFAPVMRLFRILTLSGFFHRISKTIMLMMPTLLTYIGLQFIMFYFWVIIGMEIWAGDIYPGNPALTGTVFANANFYMNNFNNFLLSYVTCFELMVVNNWQEIVSGYVAISGEVAWLFFISFNAWTVIIMFNWVVVSIIESFQLHYKLKDGAQKDPVQSHIEEVNKEWSMQLNIHWEARIHRRFRAAMQIMYGTEETEQYVLSLLGTPEEAAHRARANLLMLVDGKDIYLPPSAVAAATRQGADVPFFFE